MGANDKAAATNHPNLSPAQIAAFCDQQDRNADTIMDPAISGGNPNQAIINGTLAAGMREVTNALRDLACIERP